MSALWTKGQGLQSILFLSPLYSIKRQGKTGMEYSFVFWIFFFPKAKPYKIKINSSELLKLKSQSPRLNDI